ncbi:pyridoxal phosphate enzyme (YggS family) [Aquimarina sp. EL_43]|uniref:YggS family pyridoxal phosphate-dependent enzyme n=1 Tax=unclassified Aquimarina TaxID=2627091 RepID=UPI0018CAA3CE|nr:MULTISPECIES: YggS family pyridoxal phosphate-dependent enzyme [unclassified Aquimarina]MBG6132107.1 pyridoxal phosphate enzyme (YggS family) [Aquimarina sp. EL_35]MBG6152904.1 pyridoxal phosphate enzyme (YggS family) [Aquimarina sp. EL_32]MBG6170911.1 pyridoxal phosphate enzyme (YggS family) [Aquimarina sp. EL_43]
MNDIEKNLLEIKTSIPEGVTLVAVSKTKPVSDLMNAYDAGQRIFGENKIQEMAEKWETMPKDISWHMIGHVQTNKVKYMAPFVDLIHAVDSYKLLKEINKQAKKHNRTINCLLQIKIAKEESKFGLSEQDAITLLNTEEVKNLTNVNIQGLMGMATFTDDEQQISDEFKKIASFSENIKTKYPQLKTLSIGMSGDYKMAIDFGSTMVRIGSSIFGARNYQ